MENNNLSDGLQSTSAKLSPEFGSRSALPIAPYSFLTFCTSHGTVYLVRFDTDAG